MIHELKISNEYFNSVACGFKKFECRINDRNYQVDDILLLKEFNGDYTGREVKAKVTYILADDSYTKENMIIMSIDLITDNN